MLSIAFAQVCDAEEPLSKRQLPSSYRYVFIIDTSASMMGQGDGAGRVVFPKVKSELRNFLSRVPPDTLVTIQTFDQGPGPQRSFRLPAQRAELNRYIEGLKATGQRTYVYATLLKVLRELALSSDVATSIYLFTDGQDNDPGPLTMADVAKEYRLRRGAYDWLYYITLGLSTPPDVGAALRNTPGSRALSAAPNQVPRLSEVALRPALIDLGNLFGVGSTQRDLELRTQGGQSPLVLEVSAPSIERHGSFLEVSPEQLSGSGAHSLRFSLRNPDSLPYGSYSASLCLKAGPNTLVRPGALQVKLTYHPPGEYLLKALQTQERLDLPRGQSAALRFRLEGSEWAKEPVRVSVKGLPEGLEARLNGEPGPVTLRPGEELRVELRNNGFGSGKMASPALSVQLPAGSIGAPEVPLATLRQPLTLGEQLLRWLPWLALLLALLLLLWRWTAAQNAPWATVTLVGPPPKCQETTRKLRGKRPVDLGKLFEQPELRGIKLTGSRGQNPQVEYPLHLELKVGKNLLEPKDRIQMGETVTISEGGKELGNFSLGRIRGR
ncbi:vWA domain-containing protein [Calidithermus roseus]|nr:vWA domain-containing protein [Calidithermus roseus]